MTNVAEHASQGIDAEALLDAVLRRTARHARQVALAVAENAADADEAFSAGCERFARRVRHRGFEGIDDPDHYFVRVVRNAAVDVIRAARRDRPLVASSDRSDEPDPPDVIMDITEASAQARVLLGALPDRQREAIEHAYVDDLDHQEAGRRLGLDANAFGQLLHRSRTSFRLGVARWVAGEPLEPACDHAVLDLTQRGLELHEIAHLDECPRCERFATVYRETGGRLLGVGVLVAPCWSKLRPRSRASKWSVATAAFAAAIVAAAVGLVTLQDAPAGHATPRLYDHREADLRNVAGVDDVDDEPADMAPPRPATDPVTDQPRSTGLDGLAPSTSAAPPPTDGPTDEGSGAETPGATPTRPNGTAPADQSGPTSPGDPEPPDSDRRDGADSTISIRVRAGELDLGIGVGPPTDQPRHVDLDVNEVLGTLGR